MRAQLESGRKHARGAADASPAAYSAKSSTVALPPPPQKKDKTAAVLSKELQTMKHLLKDSQTSCQYLKKEMLRLEHDNNMLKVDKENELAQASAEVVAAVR